MIPSEGGRARVLVLMAPRYVARVVHASNPMGAAAKRQGQSFVDRFGFLKYGLQLLPFDLRYMLTIRPYSRTSSRGSTGGKWVYYRWQIPPPMGVLFFAHTKGSYCLSLSVRSETS